MRPDCRPESFGPPQLELGDDRRRDFIDRSGSVYRDDGPGFRVTQLPRGISKTVERGGDTMMKVVIRGFDPVPRTTAIGSSQSGCD
jgi:hypothetical protein